MKQTPKDITTYNCGKCTPKATTTHKTYFQKKGNILRFRNIKNQLEFHALSYPPLTMNNETDPEGYYNLQLR